MLHPPSSPLTTPKLRSSRIPGFEVVYEHQAGGTRGVLTPSFMMGCTRPAELELTGIEGHIDNRLENQELQMVAKEGKDPDRRSVASSCPDTLL